MTTIELDRALELERRMGYTEGLRAWRDSATPGGGWIPVIAQMPSAHRAATSGLAFRSDYVLVKRGKTFFTAALWVRAEDGAVCWVPAFTHKHVDVEEGDLWMRCEAV